MKVTMRQLSWTYAILTVITLIEAIVVIYWATA